MQNRRGFLASALATSVSLSATRLFGQESRPTELAINDRLAKISAALKSTPDVANVYEKFADSPSHALVQWRWHHFSSAMLERHIPMVEKTNEEIFTSMQNVLALPDAGLDTLMLEGLVADRWQTQVQEYRDIHRSLIERQLTTVVPFGIAQEITPTQEKVDRELTVPSRLRTPVHQVVYPRGRTRNLETSPLARLGAGYMMHAHSNVTLLPAEDPYIDARADWAEKWGTPAEYERWVMIEREKHFVKVVQESKRTIMHLLAGSNHDLIDDVPATMSHVVITVKRVAEADAKEELR